MKQTQVLRHAGDKPRTTAQFKKIHGTGGDTEMIQCSAVVENAANLNNPAKTQRRLN